MKKAFVGILLLLTAASLVLYGMGFGAEIFGLPLYKLLIGLVLTAWIFAKLIFSRNLREKFKIFVPLSFLFMILETEVSHWASLPEENIINNWLLFLAAIIADVAVDFIIPKGKNKKMHFKVKDGDIHIGNGGNEHTFSNITHFADVSHERSHYYMSKMSNVQVFYQNTDMVENGAELQLELHCKMGNIIVRVPADWEVTNDIATNLGSTVVRENTGKRVHLTLVGENKMGSIVIENLE